MFFWEGELRRFLGEGWSMPFPSSSGKGPIWKFMEILVKCITSVRKLPVPDLAKVAEDKASEDKVIEAAIDLKVADPEVHSLKNIAENTLHEGPVPFRGCSKRRYARGGCMYIYTYWMCCPEKFQAHYEQFTEHIKETRSTHS